MLGAEPVRKAVQLKQQWLLAIFFSNDCELLTVYTILPRIPRSQQQRQQHANEQRDGP